MTAELAIVFGVCTLAAGLAAGFVVRRLILALILVLGALHAWCRK